MNKKLERFLYIDKTIRQKGYITKKANNDKIQCL